MLISQEDIKLIVSECVKRLLSETMHVIDEKLFPLAEHIYDIVNEGCKEEEYNLNFIFFFRFL